MILLLLTKFKKILNLTKDSWARHILITQTSVFKNKIFRKIWRTIRLLWRLICLLVKRLRITNKIKIVIVLCLLIVIIILKKHKVKLNIKQGIWLLLFPKIIISLRKDWKKWRLWLLKGLIKTIHLWIITHQLLED